MNYQRGLGFALVLVGIVLISSSSFGMTGAVIGVGVVEHIGTLIGLAFFMVGCVVLMAERESKESKLVEMTKRNIKNWKKLQRLKNERKLISYDALGVLAKKSGYNLKKGTNHWKVYYNDNKTPLTTPGKTGPKVVTIPYHGFNKLTYNGVLNDLLNNNPYEYVA